MRLHIFIMKCVHYADGLFNPFPPKLIKAICPPQKKSLQSLHAGFYWHLTNGAHLARKSFKSSIKKLPHLKISDIIKREAGCVI